MPPHRLLPSRLLIKLGCTAALLTLGSGAARAETLLAKQAMLNIQGTVSRIRQLQDVIAAATQEQASGTVELVDSQRAVDQALAEQSSAMAHVDLSNPGGW